MENNNINIAEILGDCPKGMELYSPIFGKVYLDEIRPHLAIVVTTDKYKEEFLYDGRYGMSGECMLFPSKEQRDWSKFQRPFVNGDIVTDEHGNIAIYKGTMWYNKKLADYYCGYRKSDNHFLPEPKRDGHFGSIEEIHYATKEEKQKLFEVIKDNGYKWNSETKTLDRNPKFKVGDRIKNKISGICDEVIKIFEDCYLVKSRLGEQATIPFDIQNNWELVPKKLVEPPKFKVGDRIKQIGSPRSYIIQSIEFDRYILHNNQFVRFKDEHIYELAPNKFDINTLVPFESRVLVRYNKESKWCPAVWGFYDYEKGFPHRYAVVGGITFAYCIPYEGNEHLRGKAEDCDSFYKTWCDSNDIDSHK